MSKLLIQEPPLQVLPSLAVNIGLNEAIVIQQLHYWLENKKCVGKVVNGKKYIYAAYQKWQEDNFPFFSIHTIQRLFCKLEEENLIISGQYSDDKCNRTKYYRINYDNAKLESCITPSCDDVKRNLTETTPENTKSLSEKPPIEPLKEKELKPKEYTPQQKMVGALAKVMNGNASLMGTRLGRFASAMIKVGATSEKVLDMYLRGGKVGWWWKYHWKGLKGQYPNEADIRNTWDRWDAPEKPVVKRVYAEEA